MNGEILTARKQLGQIFKVRREQVGCTKQELAIQLGVTENTVEGIETGRFAWDIDMQHRICVALEIKQYLTF